MIKGNINDHYPNRIIIGYQTDNNKKMYLVEWKNSDELIKLPSFVSSEILKENYSSLIVDYLENYIIKLQ